MKYIPTIATCPEWYKIHQGMCIRCYEPQPSSVPVEELPPMYYGNEKHPNLESIRKAHPEAFDTSKNNETSPPTPDFIKDLKNFIKNVEYEAYGRGFDSKLRISHMEDDVKLVKKIRETERKRVNDILDGMKKEKPSDKAYIYIGMEIDSHNQALEQAKHLINNTQ